LHSFFDIEGNDKCTATTCTNTCTTTNKNNEFTKDYCQALIKNIANLPQGELQIPSECKQYQCIRDTLTLKRRETEMAVAFAGMPSGQALSAMAARERGHLNPNQIKRRYTNRKPSDRRVW
jgi:hypothetical protein